MTINQTYERDGERLSAAMARPNNAEAMGKGRAKALRRIVRYREAQAPLPGFPTDEWTHDDWATPPELIEALEAEFGAFTLDPCATERTAKAPVYFTKAQDGLSRPWTGLVFCNPPYSALKLWLAKARRSAEEGALVVCLIPAHTDRDFWHEDVDGVAEVRFLRGRVRYIGPEGKRGNEPFGSALIIYRPRITEGGLAPNEV